MESYEKDFATFMESYSPISESVIRKKVEYNYQFWSNWVNQPGEFYNEHIKFQQQNLRNLLRSNGSVGDMIRSIVIIEVCKLHI